MNRVFSIKVLVFLMVAALVCCVVSTTTLAKSSDSKTFKLKFASWVPQQETMNYAPNLWMKAVEERTKGRVKITPYYSQTLGKAMNSLDMLRTGICDIALFPTIYFSKVFRVLDVLAIPGLVPNRTVGTEIAYTLLNKGMLDKELADYKPIVMEAFDPGVLVFTKKKVTKVKELEGMKIRFAGATTKMALESLGATPVSIPGPELYAAINSGIVDGTTISPCYMVTSGTHEIMKYVMWGSTLFEGANIVLMSRKTWNSLPCDIQLIMEELGAKAKYDYLKRGHQHDIDALSTMKATGMEIYRLSPDELKQMQKMMQVVEDKWVADMEGEGLPGKEALETAKQVVERLNW